MKDIKFDSAGLVPAVVQEGCSGKSDGSYMNEEALRRTVESGDAWYYSRSRNELWHKGETSGHFQHVRSIAVDCDADTILLTVDQIGAACHTGHKSCFFRSMTEWEKAIPETCPSCPTSVRKSVRSGSSDGKILYVLLAADRDR